MPLLEPGGYTAFRSPSNSNMLTHPARGQVNDGGQTISGYTAVASPGGATASVTVAGAAINQVPFRTPPHTQAHLASARRRQCSYGALFADDPAGAHAVDLWEREALG